MAPPTPILADYHLAQRVALYMRQRFCFEAFPLSDNPAPEPLFDLLVDTVVGMNHMVSMLVAAYNNHSECPHWTSAILSTIHPTVQSGIDIIRLDEALAPMEPGSNLDWEARLVKNFPSSITGLVDKPAIILGEGGTIVLWYIPGAIARLIQVTSALDYYVTY